MHWSLGVGVLRGGSDVVRVMRGESDMRCGVVRVMRGEVRHRE